MTIQMNHSGARPTSLTPERPPIFVVGCPRSGTTLLSRILDSHSALAIYHESYLFPIFSRVLRWYGDLKDERNHVRLIADVREVVGTQIEDVPSVEMIRRNVSAPGLASILAALVKVYAHSRGKRRGGDKTPHHYLHLGDILAALPASPVLFLIRDPRDTVSSIRRVFNTSVEGAAHAWRQAFKHYVKHEVVAYRVLYEELVEGPEAQVRFVCNAIEEEYEPVMLDFHHAVPDSLRRKGHENLSQPINASAVGRFRDMPAHDVAVIEAICGEGMEACGYTRSMSTTAAVAAPAGSVSLAEQGRLGWVVDRLKFYGFSPRRWRRGFVWWRVQLRVRARYFWTRRYHLGAKQ